MKLVNRILIGAGCVVLMLVSWIVAINAPSDIDKQLELIEQADEFLRDEIYIRAASLLEEAVGYSTENTLKAESMLKTAYLNLITQQGYQRKYTNLLETQMNRDDAIPEIYIEAANFYLGRSRLADALTVLKNGIAKTGSDELIALYENNRYGFQLGRGAYEDVTAIHGTTINVQIDGLWGLAASDGTMIVQCLYEKVSTYSLGRMIVLKDGEIYAIDSSGNRIAVPKKEEEGIMVRNEDISDFGNYANDRIPLLVDSEWKRATGEFIIGSAAFEQLGMYFNGYVAAKTNGKWGVININSEWLLPAEYDEIIMDELGRSYAQGAVFARKGNSVYLFVDGVQIGDTYEDAKPFDNEGYAAVMKNGKWGFIDTTGQVKIPYKYEDALSFGQHLAAVKQGEYWGYISLSGELVIDAGFLQAKSFSNGGAPILTERGWQFITLLEYKQGASL